MRLKYAGSIAALAVAGLLFLNNVAAQPPAGKDGKGGFGKAPGAFGKGAAKEDTTPRGLRSKTAKATPGYVLFAPITNDTTYLMDMDGKVVKTWKSDLIAASFVYLLDNGHVIRGGTDEGQSGFAGGGAGGRIQEWDFDGKLVWDFQYNPSGAGARLPHHDIAMLPNGHVLAIVWERKTAEETRAAGLHEEKINPNGMWPDMVIEFEKQGLNGARIVWEWHAWDHLVKTPEDAKAHPEKIHINGGVEQAPPAGLGGGPGAAKGKGPGAVKGPGGPVAPKGPGGPAAAKGKGGPGGGGPDADIFHMNSISYNAKLDQIVLSVPNFNEVWVIDHSTTTAQAATGAGGKSGKGGDLLYRWGNPQTYGRGTEAERVLGFEHNAYWIEDGLPGAGNMLVFSNRKGPGTNQTTLVEFAPPVNGQGRYALPASAAYGPEKPVWTYAAADFSADFISGSQRLKSGNTFVSSGPQGRMFEVTPAGEIVWEYWNTNRGDSGILAQVFPYALFRGHRLAADHPGLKGRKLDPQ